MGLCARRSGMYDAAVAVGSCLANSRLAFFVPPDSWMNGFRFSGGLPGDGLLGLRDLPIASAQGPAGPSPGGTGRK
jgi:hypothetical protein